jgi:hypothetical protein
MRPHLRPPDGEVQAAVVQAAQGCCDRVKATTLSSRAPCHPCRAIPQSPPDARRSPLRWTGKPAATIRPGSPIWAMAGSRSSSPAGSHGSDTAPPGQLGSAPDLTGSSPAGAMTATFRGPPLGHPGRHEERRADLCRPKGRQLGHSHLRALVNHSPREPIAPANRRSSRDDNEAVAWPAGPVAGARGRLRPRDRGMRCAPGGNGPGPAV